MQNMPKGVSSDRRSRRSPLGLCDVSASPAQPVAEQDEAISSAEKRYNGDRVCQKILHAFLQILSGNIALATQLRADGPDVQDMFAKKCVRLWLFVILV
jgi:hypothetical protein